MEGILNSTMSFIHSLMMLLSQETMRTTTLTSFAFLLLLHRVDIYRFWRNREFCTFFQRCLQPLHFFRSLPPTQSSLLVCTGIQFSHDYLCTFNNQIKIEGCEQCKLIIKHDIRYKRLYIKYFCRFSNPSITFFLC